MQGPDAGPVTRRKATGLTRLNPANVANLDFAPVARETLHAQIYARIKECLITGRFTPGQKLPLRSLAHALGTSAMPVRDALQRLESIGVLVAQPNRTMAVPKLEQKELVEIRDVRLALEGLAAERAATNADAADVRKLGGIFAVLERAADNDDSAGFLRANWLFHRCIAEASHSNLIVSMIEPLWLKMGPWIRLSKPDQARILRALPFHRAAFEAVAAGEAARARAAVTADITGCFEIFLV